MQRSSETIGAIAARPGQGPGRTDQPGKVADRDHSSPCSRARRTGHFAMPRYRPASTSSGSVSVSMRLRWCRPRLSKRKQA